MSQPREYQSASIEVTLLHGDVTARLHGRYWKQVPASGGKFSADRGPNTTSIANFCKTFNLPLRTALTEYTKRCAAAARQHPEMSPEQAEKAALLAWVKDMEAVASEGHEPA